MDMDYNNSLILNKKDENKVSTNGTLLSDNYNQTKTKNNEKLLQRRNYNKNSC